MKQSNMKPVRDTWNTCKLSSVFVMEAEAGILQVRKEKTTTGSEENLDSECSAVLRD